MGKILKMFIKNKGSVIMTVLIVILAIGMLIGTPFLFIFALRLLGLSTPYNFYSWLGAFIIMAILSSSGSSKSKE